MVEARVGGPLPLAQWWEEAVLVLPPGPPPSLLWPPPLILDLGAHCGAAAALALAAHRWAAAAAPGSWEAGLAGELLAWGRHGLRFSLPVLAALLGAGTAFVRCSLLLWLRPGKEAAALAESAGRLGRWAAAEW